MNPASTLYLMVGLMASIALAAVTYDVTCTDTEKPVVEIQAAFFSDLIGDGTEPYADVVDDTLRKAHDILVEYVSGVAANSSLEVCEPCLEAVKQLVCAGAFPPPGLYACFFGKVLQNIDQLCPQLCPTCKGSGCCFLLDDTQIARNITDCGPNDAAIDSKNTDALKACRERILEPENYDVLNVQQIVCAFQTSFQGRRLMPSRAECERVVRLCSCRFTEELGDKIDRVCKAYPVDGYDLPEIEAAFESRACNSVTGWCSAANSKRGAAGDPFLESDNIIDNTEVQVTIAEEPVATQAMTAEESGTIAVQIDEPEALAAQSSPVISAKQQQDLADELANNPNQFAVRNAGSLATMSISAAALCTALVVFFL